MSRWNLSRCLKNPKELAQILRNPYGVLKLWLRSFGVFREPSGLAQIIRHPSGFLKVWPRSPGLSMTPSGPQQRMQGIPRDLSPILRIPLGFTLCLP